jgi:hypothetical protein
VACAVAAIADVRVAVLALLAASGIDDAVAAARERAIGTAGVRRRVAVGGPVVAGFETTGIDGAVPANGDRAGTE